MVIYICLWARMGCDVIIRMCELVYAGALQYVITCSM